MSERFTKDGLERIARFRDKENALAADLARELLEAQKKIRGLEADARMRDTALEQAHANHLAECREMARGMEELRDKLSAEKRERRKDHGDYIQAVHDATARLIVERDALRTQLATVTAERDALLVAAQLYLDETSAYLAGMGDTSPEASAAAKLGDVIASCWIKEPKP